MELVPREKILFWGILRYPPWALVSKQTGEPKWKRQQVPAPTKASLKRFQLAENPETCLVQVMIKENLQFNSGKQKDHWWVTPSPWWPHTPAQLCNTEPLRGGQAQAGQPPCSTEARGLAKAFHWVWLPGGHKLCLTCLGSGNKSWFYIWPSMLLKSSSSPTPQTVAVSDTSWLVQPHRDSWEARSCAKSKLNTMTIWQ